jgi:hypothetical protein
MRYQGRIIKVDVRHGVATYVLVAGDDLSIVHHGKHLTVGKEEKKMDIPAPPNRPSPSQPAGRAPTPRHGRGDQQSARPVKGGGNGGNGADGQASSSAQQKAPQSPASGNRAG